jgi:hypothetical protein
MYILTLKEMMPLKKQVTSRYILAIIIFILIVRTLKPIGPSNTFIYKGSGEPQLELASSIDINTAFLQQKARKAIEPFIFHRYINKLDYIHFFSSYIDKQYMSYQEIIYDMRLAIARLIPIHFHGSKYKDVFAFFY